MALRIVSLLLFALMAGPMSLSARAVARPENRVGNFFSSPLKSAADFASQPVDTRQENGGYGYDFASGVHKYLYCQADPINHIDPSGNDIGDMLAVADISGVLDGLSSIAGKIKSIMVGGGAPGTGHTTVHIWSYRGKDQAWGHASMTLKDNTH